MEPTGETPTPLTDEFAKTHYDDLCWKDFAKGLEINLAEQTQAEKYACDFNSELLKECAGERAEVERLKADLKSMTEARNNYAEGFSTQSRLHSEIAMQCEAAEKELADAQRLYDLTVSSLQDANKELDEFRNRLTNVTNAAAMVIGECAHIHKYGGFASAVALLKAEIEIRHNR